MKLSNVLIAGMAVQSHAAGDAEQKFRHLKKVYPQMLELFFTDPAAENSKGAGRVMNRYMDNFALKHDQVQDLWDACPEADINNSFQRIDLDELGRFDKNLAKKAFNQITNGYKILLDAMDKSGCKKTKRYEALTGRFTHIANMLKWHYCHKVNTNADWCKRHRSNPRLSLK